MLEASLIEQFRVKRRLLVLLMYIMSVTCFPSLTIIMVNVAFIWLVTYSGLNSIKTYHVNGFPNQQTAKLPHVFP